MPTGFPGSPVDRLEIPNDRFTPAIPFVLFNATDSFLFCSVNMTNDEYCLKFSLNFTV